MQSNAYEIANSTIKCLKENERGVKMAFEGLSSKLQDITRKLRGKARITESDLKEMLREVKLALATGY